jgi:DNA-binding NarL/FixJ family response regulator
MTRKVLFVDDEPEVIASIQAALHKEPYEIVSARGGEEALRMLEDQAIDVVVSDEDMPGMRGSEFLAEVQKRHPRVLRVMISGGTARETLIDAVNNAGIYRFISKPVQAAQLAKVLRDALTVGRVAEAQMEVWEAAKAQHMAMQRLASPEGDHESISEEAVTAARFAGFAPSEASGDLDKIGELPKEHADRLSTRERQIVEALASGRRVKDIAQDLVISTHTVRNHLKAIYRKLNVRSQFELLSLMARNATHRESPG